MDSSVKTRLNHYETLGLSQTASGEQIKAAFARKMGMLGVHPLAAGARICAAYETLRDPARRRAYDRSLAPPAELQPRSWSIAAPRWNGALGAAPTVRADPAPIPAVQIDPQALPTVGEPRTGSAIAASLRDLAAPGVRELSPAPRPQGEPERRPGSQPQAAVEEPLRHAEQGAIHWQRPALAVGALVLGVGLFGAWAEWEAGNDVAVAAPEQAVTLAVPPPEASPAAAVALSAPAPRVAEARPEPRAAKVAKAPARRAIPRPIRLTPAEEQELAGNQFVDSATQQVASAANVSSQPAKSPPAAVAAAKLPLPNAVVARTIGRIGYACGQVASTSAVEGESGVFKVTCTSGHSYRAAPVRGRYHFRRWDR